MPTTILDDGKTIKITTDGVVDSVPKEGTKVFVNLDTVVIETPTGNRIIIDYNDVTTPTVASSEELREAILKILNKSVNVGGDPVLSDAIALNATTSTTIAVENIERVNFFFSNPSQNRDVWLKLQAASVDNKKNGIFVPRNGYWEMPESKYKGEISAIADSGNPDVYYTEN